MASVAQTGRKKNNRPCRSGQRVTPGSRGGREPTAPPDLCGLIHDHAEIGEKKVWGPEVSRPPHEVAAASSSQPAAVPPDPPAKPAELADGGSGLGAGAAATPRRRRPPVSIDDVARVLPLLLTSTELRDKAWSRAARGYLESIAKEFQTHDECPEKLVPLLEPECGKWVSLGKCSNSHTFAMPVVCGREWCPDCGEKWSEAHKRRFARVWPKISRMEQVGYLVITLPKEIRENFKKTSELTLLDKCLQLVLKRHGFDRGVSRWHWFGNKAQGWNPHYNALVDGRWIPSEELVAMKAELARMLRVDQVVMHYRFSDKTGKVVHWAKYVTRATFKQLDGNEEYAYGIFNFRNTRSWGKFTGKRFHVMKGGEELLEAMVKLMNGICPKCGEKVEWELVRYEESEPDEVADPGGVG